MIEIYGNGVEEEEEGNRLADVCPLTADFGQISE